MSQGKFITFEGGEGSGKSTQARLLADRLRAAGISAILTREPGGSPLAERVRALLLDPATPSHSPLSEALLFYAARADHLDKTIRPALAAGSWVICDRFSDSTRVYQGAAGGLGGGALAELEKLVVTPTSPDLTFILDLEPSAGLTRARARSSTAGSPPTEADPFERRSANFHERLRAGYLALASADAQRCAVLDGDRAPAAIAEEIWSFVERRLLRSAP